QLAVVVDLHDVAAPARGDGGGRHDQGGAGGGAGAQGDGGGGSVGQLGTAVQGNGDGVGGTGAAGGWQDRDGGDGAGQSGGRSVRDDGGVLTLGDRGQVGHRDVDRGLFAAVAADDDVRGGGTRDDLVSGREVNRVDDAGLGAEQLGLVQVLLDGLRGGGGGVDGGLVGGQL